MTKISPTALQALHSLFLYFLKYRISMGLHSHLSCKVFPLCNFTLSFSVIIVSLTNITGSDGGFIVSVFDTSLSSGRKCQKASCLG